LQIIQNRGSRGNLPMVTELSKRQISTGVTGATTMKNCSKDLFRVILYRASTRQINFKDCTAIYGCVTSIDTLVGGRAADSENISPFHPISKANRSSAMGLGTGTGSSSSSMANDRRQSGSRKLSQRMSSLTPVRLTQGLGTSSQKSKA
jgi:hypothetical protein